jgi:hypothetical protein
MPNLQTMQITHMTKHSVSMQIEHLSKSGRLMGTIWFLTQKRPIWIHHLVATLMTVMSRRTTILLVRRRLLHQ